MAGVSAGQRLDRRCTPCGMERITTYSDEVLGLWQLLEERGEVTEFTSLGYGCDDGRDAYELAAPCGCAGRWVYDHSDHPAPAFVPCEPERWLLVPTGPSLRTAADRRRLVPLAEESFDSPYLPWDGCDGYRSRVPTAAEFVACELHVGECRRVVVDSEREAWGGLAG